MMHVKKITQDKLTILIYLTLHFNLSFPVQNLIRIGIGTFSNAGRLPGLHRA